MYDAVLEQIKQIISEENEQSAVQKVVDVLYEQFDTYNWVGVYLVDGKDLVLGPWRGEQATEHTRIPIGKGVCGAAAETGKTEIVPNVSEDPRYLSCFVSTKSEIVVPIKQNGMILGEIDIDSDKPNAFDEEDAVFLEAIAEMISVLIK